MFDMPAFYYSPLTTWRWPLTLDFPEDAGFDPEDVYERAGSNIARRRTDDGRRIGQPGSPSLEFWAVGLEQNLANSGWERITNGTVHSLLSGLGGGDAGPGEVAAFLKVDRMFRLAA